MARWYPKVRLGEIRKLGAPIVTVTVESPQYKRLIVERDALADAATPLVEILNRVEAQYQLGDDAAFNEWFERGGETITVTVGQMRALREALRGCEE